MNKYEQLFRPFKLGNYSLKNRFVLSPMTLSLATKDGKVTIEEEKYSTRRADCAPLLISGGTYFDDFGQLFEYGYSAKSDDDIESLKSLLKLWNRKAILQFCS
nr:hypothetical protein [Mycoplasmopsis agalactiae]